MVSTPQDLLMMPSGWQLQSKSNKGYMIQNKWHDRSNQCHAHKNQQDCPSSDSGRNGIWMHKTKQQRMACDCHEHPSHGTLWLCVLPSNKTKNEWHMMCQEHQSSIEAKDMARDVPECKPSVNIKAKIKHIMMCQRTWKLNRSEKWLIKFSRMRKNICTFE